MSAHGTAAALSSGKKRALESGMAAEDWDKLKPEDKREWVSEAMSAHSRASMSARGKARALKSGVPEDKWNTMTDELKQHWETLAHADLSATGNAASVEAGQSAHDAERRALVSVLAARGMQRAEIDSLLSTPIARSGSRQEYWALHGLLTAAAARAMANVAAGTVASPMSDSAWSLLLKNPKLEWNKLSLASTKGLNGPQKAIRQSHMYAILRQRSLAEAKMYVTWRLYRTAQASVANKEYDYTEHNKGLKERKKLAKEQNNNGASKKHKK
jgi:hypothetical protein